MTSLGIIADDLTGACDVAACASRVAAAVPVVVDPEALKGSDPFAESVSVINTQSRLLSAAESRSRLRMVGGGLAGKRFILKKIDAALRGPVGAELEGLAEALPGWRIVLAPALPSIGRTTEGGRQLDHAVPIDQTEYARDPLSPITSSEIRAIVAQTGAVGCVIRDARTDEDLRRIVAQESGSGRVVFVGSLGLADAVVGQLLKGDPPTRTQTEAWAAGPARRIVAISGSAYRRTGDQMEYAGKHLGVPVHSVFCEADLARLPPGLVDGQPLLLRVDTARLLAQGGIGPELLGCWERVLRPMAEAIRRWRPEAMAVIGGETAYRILRLLGTTALRVRGRIRDVISCGTIVDGDLGGARFSMKGGSVGDIGAVLSMIELVATGEGAGP